MNYVILTILIVTIYAFAVWLIWRICNKHSSKNELLLQYGWVIKTGSEQKKGSCADIYAENNTEDGNYTMRIDDGNCHNSQCNSLYHIYAPAGKIYEGTIASNHEFKVVMRTLGFQKK